MSNALNMSEYVYSFYWFSSNTFYIFNMLFAFYLSSCIIVQCSIVYLKSKKNIKIKQINASLDRMQDFRVHIFSRAEKWYNQKMIYNNRRIVKYSVLILNTITSPCWGTENFVGQFTGCLKLLGFELTRKRKNITNIF